MSTLNKISIIIFFGLLFAFTVAMVQLAFLAGRASATKVSAQQAIPAVRFVLVASEEMRTRFCVVKDTYSGREYMLSLYGGVIELMPATTNVEVETVK